MVLINPIMAIVSQYICVSNHHMYTLNLHEVISQGIWKKRIICFMSKFRMRISKGFNKERKGREGS